MTIKDFFFQKEISIRAYNACTDNAIETIGELKEYFNTYGNFKHLKNCGRKTDSELVGLCLKYFDTENHASNIIDKYSNQNISNELLKLDEKKLNIIEHFIKIKFADLSVRSKNALNKFLDGNVTIKNLERSIFRDNYFTIDEINDIGHKSKPELGFFLKEIKTFVLDLSDNFKEIKIEESYLKDNSDDINFLIEKLNRKQRQIINSHIAILTKELSARSQNAIKFFLDGEPNLVLLKDLVFSKEKFDLTNIRNIGESSNAEMSKYLNEIKNFIKNVYNEEEDIHLDNLEIDFLLKSRFKNIDTTILLENHYSIFGLLNALIDNNYLFSELDTFILKNAFNLYQNSSFSSLEEVGKEINLSGERVRQKRLSLFDKLGPNLQFFKNFNENILLNYGIDKNSHSIIVNKESENFINSVDNTNFSKQFITLVLSVFFEDEFVIIGNKEDTLILKESNARFRHNWQNIYLTKKKISNCFSIEKFIEDIYLRINERIEETYKFNFKSYLARFLQENDPTISDEIFSTCEIIINEEFNLFLSLNDEIVFERNSLKTLPEYALEALEDLGVPSHVNDIDNHVRVLNPTFDKKITNTNLKREFGFVPFGRKSVFGLKKWESDTNTIKGGTIRSIAEEFLLKYNEPRHISEITDYVLTYRPESNKKSIIYNLKMEDNNRFMFFKKSLIGLKSKKYDNAELVLLDETDKTEKKTWDENYQELTNFIKKNNRLPSSINCPLDEIKINRWLKVQRSKINKGILDQEKINQINQIVSNFNLRVNKSAIYRNEGYAKLSRFIKKENRLPSANKNDERQLYSFFYKQRKLFEEGSLDPTEQKKFIDLAKLVQKK